MIVVGNVGSSDLAILAEAASNRLDPRCVQDPDYRSLH
jgi:hypothetical protein